MRARTLILGLIGLGLMPGLGAQALISSEDCAEDIVALDSLVSGSRSLYLSNLASLESRDALLRARDECSREGVGGMDRVRWAEFIHGWLRSANDPHMRVRFEALIESRVHSKPPPSVLLLDESGPWERMAPGKGITQGARLAWMKRTWPWIGALHPFTGERDSVPQGEPVAAVGSTPGGEERRLVLIEELAGMSVLDHGAFLRWKISDFSSGSAGEFRRSFRKCTRRLRRSQTPIMLDLRGNLGGLRTRRHAVLSFFLEMKYWPEERERAWNAEEQDFSLVSPMPAVRPKRPVDLPVAIMVDGLSFSASLLLADALLTRQQVGLFGVEPLGFPGGCSGSPQDFTLPGSGVIVTVPTLFTSLGVSPSGSYGLPDATSTLGAYGAWSDAVRWLLSADLSSPR